jgi:hypothetical protein
MPDVPDPKKWRFEATPEEIRAAYEKAKRDFSEEDLKKFFTEEEGVPLDEFIDELKRMRFDKGEHA